MSAFFYHAVGAGFSWGILLKFIRGFTLIELMITIAIMAIIATMAAPSFSNMLERQRLNRDTQSLIAQLSKARSQAVALRQSVKLTLNSQTTDSDIDLYWSASGKNKLLNTTVTAVTFSQTGIPDTTADTQFTVCNSKLSVSRVFILSRFGSVMKLPDGVC